MNSFLFRRSRWSLSGQAQKTRQLLVVMGTVVVVGLFLVHVILINTLTSNGYLLSQLGQTHNQLRTDLEELQVFTSSRQTQEYVDVITDQTIFMVSDPQVKYVYYQDTLRAQTDSGSNFDGL